MSKLSTKVVEVGIDKLVPAEWNPKPSGDEDHIAKLARSIEEDQSAGVFAVRELTDGTYEVLDGNHRLEALKKLDVKKVQVENFGPIDLKRAVLVAHRRNHQWFREDEIAFAGLLKEQFQRNELVAIAEFMPEPLDHLFDLVDMLDWNPNEAESDPSPEIDDTEKIVIVTDMETVQLWKSWQLNYRAHSGNTDSGEALRAAVDIALAADLI